jgi:hypothetical protein
MSVTLLAGNLILGVFNVANGAVNLNAGRAFTGLIQLLIGGVVPLTIFAWLVSQ